MDETLRQLGELLFGSIPTIVFMVVLYLAYLFLVHRPLGRVLAERRSKTLGAIEKARADVAAAEAKTAEYEQKLRDARTALFQRQEARRQQALQIRVQAVADARAKAQARVQQAKAEIERDKLSARDALQGESARLASEIIRVVLQPASAGGQ